MNNLTTLIRSLLGEPTPFSRQIPPIAGWSQETSNPRESITAVSGGWNVKAGGFSATTHYARIRFKLPEVGVVLTDFHMKAVIVLPAGFYTQQISGFRLMFTDNFPAKLNGQTVGAIGGKENRTSVFIDARHRLQVVVDHEGVSRKAIYTHPTRLPVGEHALELAGSLDKNSLWFLRIDGVTVASGNEMLSRPTVPPEQRLATRVGVGIDGAASQNTRAMTLKVKTFEFSGI